MATVAEQLRDGTMRTNYDVTDRMARDLQAASDRATAANSSPGDIGRGDRDYNSSYASTQPVTPTSTTAASTTASTTTPAVDYVSQYKTQADTIAKASADALKPVYDNQLQATINPYKTAQAQIPTQTASLNNQASSQGMVNAQHIRNALAQMGLLQSGESASQQLANDTATANNINANNLAAQQLDASYNDKIAAATAQNALDYNNAVTHASEFAQQMGLSEAQLANTINQQGIDNAYRDKALAQSASQFAQQLGLSQQQFNAGLSQWAQTYAANQAQNAFNNGIAASNLTGYVAPVVSNLYPSTSSNNKVSSSANTSSSSASLPSSVAAMYPGATNVSSLGNGTYKFNDSSGNSVYYNAGVGN
ncbi:MAG: hypothetical protein Q8911_00080 [Bacillota bacterium]|nr:hypothetical protein [Bacillota bacterium]